MLREAEDLAEAIHEAKSVQMLILTGTALAPWTGLPPVEKSALARAVEEVLGDRIESFQSELKAAHDAAATSERSEELVQEAYGDAKALLERIANRLRTAGDAETVKEIEDFLRG